MVVDDHFDEFTHRAFTFTDVLADPIVQIQRDFTGDALGFHVIASLSVVPFGQHKHILKPCTKLFIKTNNLSALQTS